MRHLAFCSSLLKVLSEIQELLGMWLAALNILVWSGTGSISYWHGQKNKWCWLSRYHNMAFLHVSDLHILYIYIYIYIYSYNNNTFCFNFMCDT